jgi:hypothetical protein
MNNPERGKCRYLNSKWRDCKHPKHLGCSCMKTEKDSRSYGKCEDYRWED